MKKADVILLCGGKGTRLEGLTKDLVPKSLFKVNDKPLIEYSIDNLDPRFVGRLIFAVDHHAVQIRQWVAHAKLPYDVHFSESGPGILPAVRAALRFSKKRTVVICNTDEVRYGLSLQDVLKVHFSQRNIATMPAVWSSHLSRYRLLHLNQDGFITDSILKSPAYTNDDSTEGLVNIGFVVMQKNAQRYFDDQYGSDWSAIINPLIKYQMCKANLVHVNYFNVGTPQEYDEAVACMSAHIEEPVQAMMSN